MALTWCLGTWFSLIRMSLCVQLCKQYGLYRTPAFFLWGKGGCGDSGILVHAQQKMPTWPVANKKALGAESLRRFPGGKLSTLVIVAHCLRNWALSVWFHWERTLPQELHLIFSGFYSMTFPLLNKSFALIYHSCKSDNMLNLVNTANKSSHKVWCWENPTHDAYEKWPQIQQHK